MTAKQSSDQQPASHLIDPAALEASRNLAIEIARLIHDRHGRDIVILEMAGRSPVAYHFVIATGASEQQIRSVAREIEQLGKENNFRPLSRAGMQQGRWALIDLVDVVVHLFDAEFRRFYDLELLWGDAPKLNWQRP